jgi:RimJ/RimL family protein N-acetyltransferase
MSKADRFPLTTARLLLRPLRSSDAEASAALVSPYVSNRLLSFSYPFSVAQAAERIGASLKAREEGRAADFAIVRSADEWLMGWIGFHKKAPQDREASLGIWLGDRFQGLRYGTEAAGALVPISFDLLDIDALVATAHPDNSTSLRLLRGLGMRHVSDGLVYSEQRGRDEPCAFFRLVR